MSARFVGLLALFFGLLIAAVGALYFRAFHGKGEWEGLIWVAAGVGVVISAAWKLVGNWKKWGDE